MAGGQRDPGRRFSNHPLSDACTICERDLGGTTPVTKHAGKWYHRDCWAREHE